MSKANQAPDFITIARLLRPQGRRGELLADLFTDFPDQLSNPAGVFLVPADAERPAPAATRVMVESHWMPTGKNAGRVVVKLTGTDSINDAERLAHMGVMIPAVERPALDADTFYVSDLIGSQLYNQPPNGPETLVGTVIDVEFATTPDGRTRLPEAAPLLVVSVGTDLESEQPLIPFVRALLVNVDTARQRITMRLPEGLLETTASATT